MKNYDLLKVIASKLNGLQYPLRDVNLKDLREYCKQNGIAVCFGSSDDLMELDGAIYDEYGCYDGGTICIDEKGNADADANIYYPITAVWAKDNISWQYEFEPRHEVFNIYEDAEIYCKGIVFFVDDLKRNKDYMENVHESDKEYIRKYTAKSVLDEVSKHVGGSWLVELYEKYGLEA